MIGIGTVTIHLSYILNRKQTSIIQTYMKYLHGDLEIYYFKKP